MKKISKIMTAAAVTAFSAIFCVQADNLVIVHTNDTHSAIDPDAKSDMGGVLRRKVLVDSIRSVHPSMLLIDAGDAVQGSLYFTLFGGEVERKMMNALGYDMAIVGNHEFDNGLESLAANYAAIEAELLASNYDFSGTPLDGMFLPYSIRNVGDNRVAFIAINIEPSGLIDEMNIEGVKYSDAIVTANKLAHLLKNKEKVDRVVAITHIGYDTDTGNTGVNDINLARRSSDIDLIIGGHSHTLLEPGTERTRIANANGDTITVVQCGKSGKYIGEITMDLDNGNVDWKLIPVGKHLDSRVDAALASELATYRTKVDSIAAIKVGTTARELPQSSEALLNLTADIVKTKGDELFGRPVDLAIMNKGGIRSTLPGGTVTRGDIMTIYPFNNRLVVVEMQGSELHALLDRLSRQGGNGVSKGVEVKMDRTSDHAKSIKINGRPIDDNKTYYVATIDYLAKGNDYMDEFAGKPVVARKATPIMDDIIDYFISASASGKKVDSDDKARMSY